MVHDQGLPFHTWAKSCNTIVFVHNRSPHRILGMSTPEEDFLGKRPDVLYFKIFGSYVYYHVTKYARNKIDPTKKIASKKEFEEN